MARPKKILGELSAPERIENAFWKLLSQYAYNEITIKLLAAEAGVNHNLIYYYYTNIDDIARSAFEHTLLSNLPQLLQMLLSDTKNLEMLFESEKALPTNFQHVRLLASSDSSFLVNLLKNGLKDAWLTQAGKSMEQLSELDTLELEFIFSAIVSVMRIVPEERSHALILQFMNDNLGQSVLATLHRILHS